MNKPDAIIDEDLDKYIKSERNGKFFLCTDIRTKPVNDGETYHVYPVGVEQVNICVVCPYCKSFHIHGSCDDGDYQGLRVPTCNNHNYYIEKI